jgi:tagatose-1,6-bisphosphate aldolase
LRNATTGIATSPRPAADRTPVGYDRRTSTEDVMSFLLGTRRGLDVCAGATGTFVVLALDHRQNLRRELHPEAPQTATWDELVDFKRAVVRALGPAATGVLLDPEVGAAQCIADGSLPGSTGLLVAIEETGYGGDRNARTSRVLSGWSVEKAKRMGADAAKLLVYYHPRSRTAAMQEALVADVAAACRASDLALFVEPLSYDPQTGGSLIGEARRACVVETAKRITALGVDVLKAEFPYDPGLVDRAAWADACSELNAGSAVPWVILSGGVDDATFEAQVQTACSAGASGVVVGRSVWGPSATLSLTDRDSWLQGDGRRRLERLGQIVKESGRPWHDRASPATRIPEPAEGWWRDYVG